MDPVISFIAVQPHEAEWSSLAKMTSSPSPPEAPPREEPAELANDERVIAALAQQVFKTGTAVEQIVDSSVFVPPDTVNDFEDAGVAGGDTMSVQKAAVDG